MAREYDLDLISLEDRNDRGRKLMIDVMKMCDVGFLVLDETLYLGDRFRRMNKLDPLLYPGEGALLCVIVDVRDKVVAIFGVKVSWILHGEIQNAYTVFQEEISLLEKDPLRTTIHEEEFIGKKDFHITRFQVSGVRCQASRFRVSGVRF